MMKKLGSLVALMLLSALMTGAWTLPAPAVAPTPNVTFTLLSGLPATMNVGETATVIVQIDSNQEFVFAKMLPSFYYPGRLVRAVNTGGDRTGAGTTAILEVSFTAIASTAGYPGGVAPVWVVAGAHFQGGLSVGQKFAFDVAVP